MTRQEAIFILECVEAYGLAEDAKRIALEALKEEPVKHGHWIGLGDYPYEDFECDVCGYVVEGQDDMSEDKYCKNCGAKMDKSTMGQVNRRDAVNEEVNHEQRID